jgi:hypothetical protein
MRHTKIWLITKIMYRGHFINSAKSSIGGDTEEMEASVIRMELAEKLPVLRGIKSFDDILEFKHRRSDEFREFHDGMDELYLKIVNSGDQEFELKRAVVRLDKIISTIDTVTEERYGSPLKRSLTVCYRIAGGALTGVGGADALGHFLPDDIQLPFAIDSALLGAATNGIKIACEKSAALDNDQRIVSYLSSARSEGVI